MFINKLQNRIFIVLVMMCMLVMNGCQQSHSPAQNPVYQSSIDNEDTQALFTTLFGSQEEGEQNGNTDVFSRQLRSGCHQISYRVSSKIGSDYIYLGLINNPTIGVYRFKQEFSYSSNAQTFMGLVRKNNATGRFETFASSILGTNSKVINIEANIAREEPIIFAVFSKQNWGSSHQFKPIEMCPKNGSPTFSYISPNPVPVNASRQWIEIHGSNFVNPMTVDLIHNNQRYRIPSDRYRFVNSSKIKVFAGITEAGEWGIDIYNPNGQSSSGKFQAQGTAVGNGNDYRFINDPTNFHGQCEGDDWNFCKRHCTSFVAHRLRQNGIRFKNRYSIGHGNGGQDCSNYRTEGYSHPIGRWSHAGNWSYIACRENIPMNNNPSVGSVAQWKYKRGYPYGHVAYVSSVDRNSNGYITSILVEEYNYPRGGRYGVRRLYPGHSNYPDNFIHIPAGRSTNRTLQQALTETAMTSFVSDLFNRNY